MRWISPTLAVLVFSVTRSLVAGEVANPPAESSGEVIQCQGVKIWKKGKPTNTFTVIGYETLVKQPGLEIAQINIARGVLARKGNAAIVLSMINSQRPNLDMNTQNERLDGVDIRYQIILLQP